MCTELSDQILLRPDFSLAGQLTCVMCESQNVTMSVLKFVIAAQMCMLYDTRIDKKSSNLLQHGGRYVK